MHYVLFWAKKIALGPVARNWEYKAVLTSLESTALSYAIKSGEGTTRKLYFLTFPADFYIPIIFSNMNHNCSIF